MRVSWCIAVGRVDPIVIFKFICYFYFQCSGIAHDDCFLVEKCFGMPAEGTFGSGYATMFVCDVHPYFGFGLIKCDGRALAAVIPFVAVGACRRIQCWGEGC